MLRISIHAPVKGATLITTERDSTSVISIHAPVKGATMAVLVTGSVESYFNPRTREGCDKPHKVK